MHMTSIEAFVASYVQERATTAQRDQPTDLILKLLDQHSPSTVVLYLKALLQSAMPTEFSSIESFLGSLMQPTKGGVCGYTFKVNDIAFNCRTCQSDDTCVLCVKCFQNSNHEGHEVYFHRTSPGGICDCGDIEAWKAEGMCAAHVPTNIENVSTSPSSTCNASSMPDTFYAILSHIFAEICLFLAHVANNSIDSFDDIKVGEKETNRVRAGGSEIYHARICNDDVHTDDDLIRTLIRKGFKNAEKFTKTVDAEGSAIAQYNVPLRDALMFMKEMKNATWLVCIVSDSHIREEETFLLLLQWVKSLCMHSTSCMKEFLTHLFADNNVFHSNYDLHANRSCITSIFLSNPYLKKELIASFSDFCLTIISDRDIKMKFAHVYSAVYSRLMYKYFCGIGTMKESLFHFSVQLFTTPSVVNQLVYHNNLLEQIIDTMHACLTLAIDPYPPNANHDATTNNNTNAMGSYRGSVLDPNHILMRYRRYAHILHDFQYLLASPGIAIYFINHKELVMKWADLLRMTQHMHLQTRVSESKPHILHENHSVWVSTFSLHMNIVQLYPCIFKGLRQHYLHLASTQVGSSGMSNDDVVLSQSVDLKQSFRTLCECIWSQLTAFSELFDHRWHAVHGVDNATSAFQCIQYDVASEPVSFHYPLHHFLAKYIAELTQLPISTELEILGETDSLLHFVLDCANRFNSGYMNQLVTNVIEYPLRSFVLGSQIQASMWVRNASNVMTRQSANYFLPPLCTSFRDLDLVLLQFGILHYKPTQFLAMYFDRFQLLHWVFDVFTSNTATATVPLKGVANDKKIVLLEECILKLLWIITEILPPSTTSNFEPSSTDAFNTTITTNSSSPRVTTTCAEALIDSILRREVIHALAHEPCLFSVLLETTDVIYSRSGFDHLQGDKSNRLTRILNEVSIQKSNETSATSSSSSSMQSLGDNSNANVDPARFHLKPDCFKEYDPSFFHLRRNHHEKAQVNRNEALFKSHKQLVDAPIPIVSHLPIAHPEFAKCRQLALEPQLLVLCQAILVDYKSSNPRISSTISFLHVVHLLTVQIHVFKEIAIDKSKRQSFYRYLCLDLSGVDGKQQGNNSTNSHENEEGEIVYCKRVKLNVIELDQEFKPLQIHEKSIIALMVAYALEHLTNASTSSKSTLSAILYILEEYKTFTQVIADYITTKTQTVQSTNTLQIDQKARLQLSKLKQKQAMAKMLERQKKFAFNMSEESDDFSTLALESSIDSGGTENDSIPDCMICAQRKDGQPGACIVYIGLAQKTKVLQYAMESSTTKSNDAAARKGDNRSTTTSEDNNSHDMIHIQLCGHAVHLDCWKEYMQSFQTQSIRESLAMNVSFDIANGEFLCPCCKTFSSIIIPYAPSKLLVHTVVHADGTNYLKSLIVDGGASSEDGIVMAAPTMEMFFRTNQNAASIANWLTKALPGRLAVHSEVHLPQDEFQGLSTMTNILLDISSETPMKNSFLNSIIANDVDVMHLIYDTLTSTYDCNQLISLSNAIHAVRNSTKYTRQEYLGLKLKTEIEIVGEIYSRRDDENANFILNSLKWIPVMYPALYQSVCLDPIALSLQSIVDSASSTSSSKSCNHPEDTEGGWSKPILQHDLFTDLLVISSRIHDKPTLLMTMRSFSVLYFIQVILKCIDKPDNISTLKSSIPISMNETATGNTSFTDFEIQERSSVERLREAIVKHCVMKLSPFAPKLQDFQTIFEASSLVFLRKITLLARALFNGQNDPDRALYANFIQTLSMSTDFTKMCVQFGIPSVTQILNNTQLMSHICKYVQASLKYDSNVKLASNTIAVATASTATTDINSGSSSSSSVVAISTPTLNGLPFPIAPNSAIDVAHIKLTKLFRQYTDLHTEYAGRLCPASGLIQDSPGICLICGVVVCAGSDCCRQNGHGACTLHAKACNNGVGMFFLLRACSVLLISHAKSCYYSSPYVDEYGEEDLNLRRGRPLYLNPKRVRNLILLYGTHQIMREVSKIRRTSDHYIRENFY